MRMADTSASMALFWPNTTFFKVAVEVFSALRSSGRDVLRGDARDLGDDLPRCPSCR